MAGLNDQLYTALMNSRKITVVIALLLLVPLLSVLAVVFFNPIYLEGQTKKLHAAINEIDAPEYVQLKYSERPQVHNVFSHPLSFLAGITTASNAYTVSNSSITESELLEHYFKQTAEAGWQRIEGLKSLRFSRGDYTLVLILYCQLPESDPTVSYAPKDKVCSPNSSVTQYGIKVERDRLF